MDSIKKDRNIIVIFRSSLNKINMISVSITSNVTKLLDIVKYFLKTKNKITVIAIVVNPIIKTLSRGFLFNRYIP